MLRKLGGLTESEKKNGSSIKTNIRLYNTIVVSMMLYET